MNGIVAKLHQISSKRSVLASTIAKVQLIHVQKPLLHYREKINCTLALICCRQVDLDAFSCTLPLISPEPSNLRTFKPPKNVTKGAPLGAPVQYRY